MADLDGTTVHYRTCPLCEATCGLELTLRGDEVVRVRGDRDDAFSQGYICPKGSLLGKLETDPDRLRRPLVKRDGTFVEVDWDEAFAVVAEGLGRILADGDRNAVAAYLGNPSVHNTGLAMYSRVFLTALRSANVFSASTVDQMPKQVAAGLMFGTSLSIAVPDIDRCDYLLMLGANPFESNGSLWTVPDAPGRIAALRARGGRLVVVDPRRTRTAEAADEHLAIVPGTDAWFLLAIAHTLVADDLVDLGPLADWTDGLDTVVRLVADWPPERVADRCGIDADVIRRIAHDLAAADAAAVYARIGTCTAEFGTLTQWLVDVCNILTGNLDRVGGAMFPKAAAAQSNSTGAPGIGRGVTFGRRHSRVRGLPEVFGEFPVATLADEILTPGEGQVRALVTVAGNPVVSTPDAGRLDDALASLEFMVAVDVYVNETTRHADVILPGPTALRKGHYPIAFHQLSVRNVARWSPPVHALDADTPDEWEIMLRLAAIVSGLGADADVAGLDAFAVRTLVDKAVKSEHSPVAGRSADELCAQLESTGRVGVERMLDVMLRTGPYGDGFGSVDGGLSLDVLEASPHGVDLGPLTPRVPELLRTPTGRIVLAPEPLVADLDRLAAATDVEPPAFVLVGRRDLRSNNSWMHNIERLVNGKARCTLHVHPDDAARLGLADGAAARVASRVGEVTAPVEVTDAIRPGVVSLPHGWGHDAEGIRLSVASKHAGVNANILTDGAVLDPLSGNAVLNAIPVSVAPA